MRQQVKSIFAVHTPRGLVFGTTEWVSLEAIGFQVDAALEAGDPCEWRLELTGWADTVMGTMVIEQALRSAGGAVSSFVAKIQKMSDGDRAMLKAWIEDRAEGGTTRRYEKSDVAPSQITASHKAASAVEKAAALKKLDKRLGRVNERGEPISELYGLDSEHSDVRAKTAGRQAIRDALRKGTQEPPKAPGSAMGAQGERTTPKPAARAQASDDSPDWLAASGTGTSATPDWLADADRVAVPKTAGVRGAPPAASDDRVDEESHSELKPLGWDFEPSGDKEVPGLARAREEHAEAARAQAGAARPAPEGARKPLGSAPPTGTQGGRYSFKEERRRADFGMDIGSLDSFEEKHGDQAPKDVLNYDLDALSDDTGPLMAKKDDGRRSKALLDDSRPPPSVPKRTMMRPEDSREWTAQTMAEVQKKTAAPAPAPRPPARPTGPGSLEATADDLELPVVPAKPAARPAAPSPTPVRPAIPPRPGIAPPPAFGAPPRSAGAFSGAGAQPTTPKPKDSLIGRTTPSPDDGPTMLPDGRHTQRALPPRPPPAADAPTAPIVSVLPGSRPPMVTVQYRSVATFRSVYERQLRTGKLIIPVDELKTIGSKAFVRVVAPSGRDFSARAEVVAVTGEGCSVHLELSADQKAQIEQDVASYK